MVASSIVTPFQRLNRNSENSTKIFSMMNVPNSIVGNYRYRLKGTLLKGFISLGISQERATQGLAPPDRSFWVLFSNGRLWQYCRMDWRRLDEGGLCGVKRCR